MAERSMPPAKKRKIATGGPSSLLFSWLDLPDCLSEEILKRLPLPDYVRFGAVCPTWRSVQSGHRGRHFPSPPPIPTRPWFISVVLDTTSAPCFDPFPPDEDDQQQKQQPQYHLTLPLSESCLKYVHDCMKGHRKPVRGSDCMSCFLSLSNGWFLLDDRPQTLDPTIFSYPPGHHLTLFNPLTDGRIPLPIIKAANTNFAYQLRAAASCPAPDMAVLIATHDGDTDEVRLLRLFRTGRDRFWHSYRCREFNAPNIWFRLIRLAFCRGKFYCFHPGSRLVVFDPRPDEPELYRLDMDVSAVPELHRGAVLPKDAPGISFDLVESDGQLLLIVRTSTYRPRLQTQRFQVFAADFERKSWVKVESIGDRVFLYYRNNFVSLVAADVGLKKNCIYKALAGGDGLSSWIGFDVGSGKRTCALRGCVPSCVTHLMFVPSIY